MKENVNNKFLILQAIGIILVVLGHKGGISLFSEWFPAYSFHMPLFIFISGYFFKLNSASNVKEFVNKKVKKLLIPYFGWNIIYGIIITILIRNGVVLFGNEISFKSLFITPWINGHQFILNLAAWFVLALFLVQVIYVLFRKLFIIINLKNEYIIMLIFIFIGCIGVKWANRGIEIEYTLPVIRTMFLIPFYHLGYLYNQKLESRDNFNNTIYFIVLFLFQFILIDKYDNITFQTVGCNDFNRYNIMLPYITSITGIMFWLKIAEILEPALRESKVVNYIGENTWTIMMHHIFVFFIINLFLGYLATKIGLQGFDYESFKTNIYYGYILDKGIFLMIYVVLGISMPLLIKYYGKKIIEILIDSAIK